MKGRRFLLLALIVFALLLCPYSALSGHKDTRHEPYDALQESVPKAYFDIDGDLLRDTEEVVYGTDPEDVDTDDDLCPDGVEVANWLALAEEATPFTRDDLHPLGDPDGDGLPNIRDPDSDNDGLLDGWEFENELDPSTAHTFSWLLPDRFHYYPFYSGDPRDLDGDGMPDDWESAFDLDLPGGDEDGDGVDNVGEYLNGTDPTGPDSLYGDTPTKLDQDGDSVVDEVERALGLDPSRRDSDHDGVDDGTEMYDLRSSPFDTDTDRDRLSDAEELLKNSSALMVDTDGEGLVDLLEGVTDPRIPDTDKDLIPDSEESEVRRDSDSDGIPDAVELASEYINGATDPNDPDTDGDGLRDGQEDANRNGRRDGNDPWDRNSDWREGGETDPTTSDTDGGGDDDRNEIFWGQDPLDPNDDTDPRDPPPDRPDPPRPPDPIDPINPPDPPDPIDLRGIGRVILVLLIVLLAVVLMTMMYNTATTKDDFLEDVIEALEEGEQVLYAFEVTEGDDVRETIINAYRKFLAVMAAYGHSRGEPSTAREFAMQIRKAIDVDGSALHRFTVMFELARYSHHSLNLGHRDRALAAFTAVRESVSMDLGPPGKRVVVDDEEVVAAPTFVERLKRLRGKT